MKGRVLFLISYYCFWLLVFWVFKGLFLLYHSSLYIPFSWGEIFKIFLFGSRMDISFACYISLLPLLMTAFSCFGGGEIFRKIISGYTYILLIIISILSVSDLEVFRWWGFRIDSTLFKYLTSPAEAAASISVTPVWLLIIFILGFSIFFISFYKKLIYDKMEFKNLPLRQGTGTFLFALLFIPLMIIGIRGGLQLSPINQSAVCFSNNPLLNQAAINTPWNFCYSILESNYSEDNPYISFSEEEASLRLAALYPKEEKGSKLIKDGNVNIVLVVWESFTAKAVESLGGKKGITPQFEKLIREGIFFSNIYASGDRSDKGLISILSAFPAQPTTSIMTRTTKAVKLPSITNTFRKNGYYTSFYYGGEPEFANIKSYLLNSGFQNIVAKENFPSDSWNSKWGAHDEAVFEKLLKDSQKFPQKFFATLFTLSSHEPFEIPSSPLLNGSDEETLFLNSIHYTDSCLYDFIRKAEKEKWWDNTLIIITADHGHRLPGNSMARHLPDEFHIPMLWLGGALAKKDTVISKIGSQTDLAATLLRQLEIQTEEFIFSKDLTGEKSLPFSYYTFNNGFGFISREGKYVFDNISKTFILKDSAVTEENILNGKAYLQYSFQEYLNK